MAKVYAVSYTRTDKDGSIKNCWMTGIYKTLDSARREIEKIRDEYRADESITIIGEYWSLGDYPCYEATFFEDYYLNTYGEKRTEVIKYFVEEHELAD